MQRVFIHTAEDLGINVAYQGFRYPDGNPSEIDRSLLVTSLDRYNECTFVQRNVDAELYVPDLYAPILIPLSGGSNFVEALLAQHGRRDQTSGNRTRMSGLEARIDSDLYLSYPVVSGFPAVQIGLQG